MIQNRANELLAAGLEGVRRVTLPRALAAATTHRYDFLRHYVDDLPSVVNLDAIRVAGVRIGADPLGGASVEYWAAIADAYDLDLTVVNPRVDPTWRFMTLDWDGNIRMDCSSPHAMASLIATVTAPGMAGWGVATWASASSWPWRSKRPSLIAVPPRSTPINWPMAIP